MDRNTAIETIEALYGLDDAEVIECCDLVGFPWSDVYDDYTDEQLSVIAEHVHIAELAKINASNRRFEGLA